VSSLRVLPNPREQFAKPGEPRPDGPPAPRLTHEACVAALMRGRSAVEQQELLRAGLEAIRRRAEQTLGEVTLGAIVDRVLYTGRAHHPSLGGLSVGTAGFHFDNPQPAEPPDVLRFVVIELLTVLGSLTAEILTPALHAALSAVTLVHRKDEDTGGARP
jgi:hypothetical protein